MDVMNVIVASIVFVIFVVIILQYAMDLFVSGHIHEAARNLLGVFTEGFESVDEEDSMPEVMSDAKAEEKADAKAEEKAESTPEKKLDATSIDGTDYATLNATNISELYDKVNSQTDIIRTLKVPYSEKANIVSYSASDSPTGVNMNVFNNLLTLLQQAIKPNDDDLKSNVGITQIYQYTGNESINELISELGLLSEQTIANQHKSLPTDACNDAVCIQKIYKQFDRKLEADYIAKVAIIVNSQQTIIDKVLQKQG